MRTFFSHSQFCIICEHQNGLFDNLFPEPLLFYRVCAIVFFCVYLICAVYSHM